MTLRRGGYIPDLDAHVAEDLAGAQVGDVEARAAAYLEWCEVAIEGSGGSTTTFLTAQRIVRGFDLDVETAYRLMCPWNARCQPPWSEGELRRKIKQADEVGTFARGSLRDAERGAK